MTSIDETLKGVYGCDRLGAGQAKTGRLLTDTYFSLGETMIVFVVVALDQFAVDHLLATACSRHVPAEIRMWAAKIAKHRER